MTEQTSPIPNPTPAPLRPAATVILLTPDARVLLIRRARSMGFFGDAFAFPGGRVDAEDLPSEATQVMDYWAEHHHAPASVADVHDHARLAAAYTRAAQREAQEEVGLEVPLAGLKPWARWMTPEAEPKRFDTLFFVAPLPAGEIRLNEESSEYKLLTPAQALQDVAAEAFRVPPPTMVVLAELAERGSIERIWASAQAPIPEILPRIVQEDGATFILLPGDAGNPSKQVRPWPIPVTPRLRLDGWPPKFTFV